MDWSKRRCCAPKRGCEKPETNLFLSSVKRSALPLVCGFGCTRGGQDSTVQCGTGLVTVPGHFYVMIGAACVVLRELTGYWLLQRPQHSMVMLVEGVGNMDKMTGIRYAHWRTCLRSQAARLPGCQDGGKNLFLNLQRRKERHKTTSGHSFLERCLILKMASCQADNARTLASVLVGCRLGLLILLSIFP